MEKVREKLKSADDDDRQMVTILRCVPADGLTAVEADLHDFGHDFTALDFSEAMLAVARNKDAGKKDLRFILADAENTMQPDGVYDAIICRLSSGS